jgi:two-component system response regulator
MTKHNANHPVIEDEASILIVDDNPDDVELTTRALRRARLLNPIIARSTGLEALQLLQRQQYEPSQNPATVGLILLDLNLPGMDGRGLLETLHSDRRLRQVPVVVLTGSELTRDRLRSYKRGALAFLNKPIDVSELLRVLAELSGASFYLVHQAA